MHFLQARQGMMHSAASSLGMTRTGSMVDQQMAHTSGQYKLRALAMVTGSATAAVEALQQ